MDFRKLQAFCKVYELRSFSKAGKDLFLSQPTISAHVQGLEEELGLLLFDRIGRSVMPTGAADILYKTGVDVFRQLDIARSEIDLLQDRVAGEILIGASTIPAHWVLPTLFAKFSVQYPDVSFSLHVQGTTDIVDRVAEGELDVGMVGAKTNRHGLISVPMLEDEVVAVAMPGFAENAGLTDKPLKEWPWILRERSSGTRKVFEAALEAAGHRIGHTSVSVRLDSTQGVLSFARAGLGVGILSRLAAATDLDSKSLVILDLGIPPIKRHLNLIYLEGRSLPPAVQAFIGFV